MHRLMGVHHQYDGAANMVHSTQPGETCRSPIRTGHPVDKDPDITRTVYNRDCETCEKLPAIAR
ncbi:hypothetical protein GCM10012278_52040 [Nonomuraea glycinis]|uniref:Uncharacterized protein n=1 Tax=Nonomuraea glycinis TaxID=2047744 RepID=A0A918E6N5_9ACTN|nr:hypothetical protein GCM10012278_52040 [Nonomuraea glycinis]